MFNNLFKKVIIFFVFCLSLFFQEVLYPLGRKLPSYVVNIPAYVSSGDEGITTNSEIEPDKYHFTEKEFDDPPFYINHEKRGKIVLEFILPENFIDELEQIITSVHLSPDFEGEESVIQALIDRLYQTGFNRTENLCYEDLIQQRLSLAVCLNRPRSLSTKKNMRLSEEIRKKIQNSENVRYFGAFWDFPWERKHKARNRTRKIYPLYKEVLSFYKQLKKRNPENARAFRRNNENPENISRNRMVPYRSLREIVKNHQFTRELVALSRQRNSASDAYLFFCDSDTVSFNGCFSTFDEIYQSSEDPAAAMTTGYIFDAELDKSMIKFASILDMCVRQETSRFIPRGVYYPDPCLCVKIKHGEDTVLESFENIDGKIESDYTSPQESVRILKQVSQRPEILSGLEKLRFWFKNTLITKMPKRATLYKVTKGDGGRNELSFDAEWVASINKFKLWSMHDLVNATSNTCQSHAIPRSWAINLLNAFEFDLPERNERGKYISSKKINIDGDIFEINERIGNVIRDMAISLLTRLFKSYNPISMAQENKQELVKILLSQKKYNNCCRRKTIPTVNERRTRAQDVWYEIDNITSRKKLLLVLSQFLKNCDSDLINQAASHSGMAIWNTLKEYFDLSTT